MVTSRRSGARARASSISASKWSMPDAARVLERALRDLYGLEPVGSPDTRPWLDLGFWDVQHPLGECRDAPPRRAPYAFLPAAGEGLHQIPVGPVHAGIIEPGHFRFTANGETVVRLEQRLGYVHKGIEALMAGANIDTAARLAGRTSGDSTVAYALAFAHAVEAAVDVEVPPRAIYLRALMAELERLANHFGDIGAICNDASFSLMHAQCGILREKTLRAAESCFGHRLMMDVVVPGGVACDLASGCVTEVAALLKEVRRRFPELVELYDNTASLQDRTATTGILRSELARQFGAGGYVGRASGRAFDARKMPGYPPYDQLDFEIPVFEAGDVNARVWVRIREVEQSQEGGRVTGWEGWLWERFYFRSHSGLRCLRLLPLRRLPTSCAKLSARARLVTVAPTLSPMPNGRPLSGANGAAEFASSAIAFRRIDYWLDEQVAAANGSRAVLPQQTDGMSATIMTSSLLRVDVSE
jgi:Ni,Fe-hydrogenase III large subunit